jgi:DNA polymerase-3 subunit epsilon
VIHDLLQITRKLIVLDTETTGTNDREDRVIELGFQVWQPTGLEAEWRSYINPGVPIPPASAAVHHITDAMVRGCRQCGRQELEHPTPECGEFHPCPYFKQIAARIASGFSDCDYAGKNVRFDLRIMAAEMRRAGVEWGYGGARVVCGDRLEALLNPRSLSHLHRKYTGREHDGAHGALSDVRASTTVIAHQLQQRVAFTDEGLPRDLDALHALQWPNWIDPEGKFRFVEGVPCFTNWGKYANKPMTAADGGYWDFILRSDFSPDVKRIAAEAKMRRYPKEAVK